MTGTWQKGVPSASGNSAPRSQKAQEEAENGAKAYFVAHCYYNEKWHSKFIPLPVGSIAELSGMNRSGTMRDPFFNTKKHLLIRSTQWE